MIGEKKGVKIVFVSLLIMAVIVYFDFLVGNSLFFVNSVDTITNFVPNIINIHNIIYSGEIPMWSFAKGLGANVMTGNPVYLGDVFTLCTALLPIDLIPYAIGWMFVVKLILSGVLFYIYLCEFKSIGVQQKILGALLYAFNGHMLCRGQWFHYATEVVMVVPWLIGLERWHTHKNRMLFPITFALLLISRNASYIYIYSLFSFSYIVVRYLFDHGLKWTGLIKQVFQFVGVYLCGLGISGFLVLPGVINLMSSGRVGGNVDWNLGRIFSGLHLETAEKISAAIMKIILPNGTGIFKTQNGNVLEDACFYGGIISIVFIPTIIGNKKIAKRKKCVIFLIIACVCFYLTVSWPKQFLNAFMLSSIKTSSFWINIVIIMLGLYALSHYDFRIKNLILKNIFFLGVFLILAYTNIIIIQGMEYTVVIGACIWILYVTIINLESKNWNRMQYMLTVLSGIELILFAQISITFKSDFPIYTIDEFKKYVNEYAELNNLENNGFYRIARDKNNYYYFNVAMINNYFGLTEYDSIISAPLLETKAFFELNTPSDNIIYGIENLPALSGVLSTKYMVSNKEFLEEGFDNYQFSKKMKDGKNLFFNMEYLPFGFTYEYKIQRSKLEMLPVGIKDDLIKYTAILEAEDYNNVNIPEWGFDVNEQRIDISMLDGYNNITVGKKKEEIIYECMSDDPQISFRIPNLEGEKISIEFKLESDSNHQGQIFYSINEGQFDEINSTTFEVKSGESNYQIELKNANDIEKIRFDIGDKGDFIKIKNLVLKGFMNLPQPVEYSNDYLRTKIFRNNRIEGEIYCKANQLLFLSIPYDSGWHIRVNGEKRKLLQTNIGFNGIELQAGRNEIELTYRTPGLWLGCLITLLSLLVYATRLINLKKQLKVGLRE